MAKVLVVDDEEPIRELLADILSDLGHVPLAAESGLEALKISGEATPGLILLDVMMPEMDGYEVLNHLKENGNTKNILVVMVSALAEEQVRRGALKYGVEYYITKPWTIDSLDVTIQLALGIRDNQN